MDNMPTNILKYPTMTMLPTSGAAIILDIIKTVEIVLKFIIVIGNIIICADIVIDNILDIFSFMYFNKKVSIFLLKYTIPKVPRYDNCKPISLIVKGLSTKIIINDIAIEFIISCFLCTTFENNIIIPIIHALTTDGLKPSYEHKKYKYYYCYYIYFFLWEFAFL